MSACATEWMGKLVLLLVLLGLSPRTSAADPAFGFEGHPIRTQLDLRVIALTNRITPISRVMTNGRGDVVVLWIRVENRSPETITAEFAHEWFGGMWGYTDLRAAARRTARLDEWRASPAYLVGEKGTITEPTVWRPGERHDFAVRLNWPGTGSRGAQALIWADAPGNYFVRIGFTFKTAKSLEYFESPDMAIELLKRRERKTGPNQQLHRTPQGRAFRFDRRHWRGVDDLQCSK
jgi:hypothetical protein